MSCVHCQMTEDLYYCICDDALSFCKSHIDTHLKTPCDHRLRSVDNQSFLVLSSQKSSLFQRIHYIKQQSELIKEEIKLKAKEFISSLKKSSEKAIENLNYVVNQADEVLRTIDSLSSIHKKILSPIEHYLCSIQKYDPIDDLIAPRVVFPTEVSIKLSLSTFIHELLNYSNLTLSFKENHLVVYPKTCSLFHELFSSSSRCMQVSPYEVMVTGMSENKIKLETCIIVNLHKKSIKSCAKFNHARKWHAMAWLNGFPGILGGNDKVEDLKSVEIYKGEAWIQISSLQIPRSSFSALCYMDKVWAVGGINNETMNNIEMFENDYWSLLQIKSNVFCSSVGLAGIGKYLMIFGGFRGNRDSVLALYDIEDETVHMVIEFNEEFYFNLNSLSVNSDRICGLDNNYLIREIPKVQVYPRIE